MKPTLSRLLIAAAKADPKVMVLTGDHGFSLFADFRRECPKQFLNCGIAEQNMIGVAAGLAREGFRPIAYALAAFMPCRTVEQIKLDVCYPNLPVVLLGDGAGLVYSYLGPSHHACEDIALVRSLPNLTVYSPADGNGLTKCFNAALSASGPTYIRMGKSDLGNLPLTESIGQDGGSAPPVLLVATGSMSHIAHKVAFALRNARIVNVNSLKPLTAPIVEMARGASLVATIEEHSLIGGLGSAVAELLTGEYGMPLHLRFGIPDAFRHEAGTWDYQIRACGLDPESIVKRIGEMSHG